jgi:hypothetical protein
MFEKAVEIILLAAALYALCGVAFAVVFHLAGLIRFDHGAHGAGWFFRVVITPGLIALWPLLARKWRRAAGGGSFAGSGDAPINARGLRRFHRLWWQLLAVLVPLLIAAALFWRPDEAGGTSSRLPVAQQPPSN